jgi:hypothetical protein
MRSAVCEHAREHPELIRSSARHWPHSGRRWRERRLKAGGPERDLALARLTLGSTIALVTAFDMAMDGHITGGGPADST